MRKIILLTLFCLMFALPAQAKEEIYEFSFQSMLPDNHAANIYITEWAADLEKNSNGRLKMNLFTNSSLTRYDKVLTGITGGVVDIAMTSVSFNQNTFPYAQALAMPFLADDTLHATRVLWELWKQSPEFRAEFDNTEMLTMWCVDRSVLLSTKSLIKNPSDLKGKRVLIGSGIQSDEVSKWGGSGIVIATTDIYVGLQRGMGEVNYGQITSLAPFKLYEVAKYLTILPSCQSPLYIVVNNDFMKSLPEDLQALLRDSTGEKMGMEISAIYRATSDADEAMMRNEGVTVYVPNEEEMESFKALSMEATIPMWTKIYKDGGVPDPEAWIKKVYDIAESVK